MVSPELLLGAPRMRHPERIGDALRRTDRRRQIGSAARRRCADWLQCLDAALAWAAVSAPTSSDIPSVAFASTATVGAFLSHWVRFPADGRPAALAGLTFAYRIAAGWLARVTARQCECYRSPNVWRYAASQVGRLARWDGWSVGCTAGCRAQPARQSRREQGRCSRTARSISGWTGA